MKTIKLLSILVSIFLVTTIYANNKGFKYQALVTDEQGRLASYKQATFRFTIINEDGTESYYQETQQVDVNNGIVVLVVGIGEPILDFGMWDDIPWKNRNIALRCEIDKNSSNTFELLTEKQLLSVPYALYADQTDVNSLSNIIKVNDPFYLTSKNDTLVTIVDNKIGIGTTNPRGDIELGKNKRIHLSSDEWHLGKSGVITFQAKNNVAKPSFTWYDELGNPHAAMTMYDRSEVDTINQREFAIETCNGEGELLPRITIPYGRKVTEINFFNSNFVVNGGTFSVGKDYTSNSKSYFYGDVYAFRRLGVGQKDWLNSGFTNGNAILECYNSNTTAEVLVRTDGDSKASLLLQRSDTTWSIENNSDLRFSMNDSLVMVISKNSKVGIGTSAPSEALEVNGNIKSSGSIHSEGSAYVINFESETTIYSGSPIGVNPTNGKARIYQDGDYFIGVSITKSNSGFVGNTSIDGSNNTVRVAVMGVAPLTRTEHYVLENGVYKTVVGNVVIGTKVGNDLVLIGK